MGSTVSASDEQFQTYYLELSKCVTTNDYIRFIDDNFKDHKNCKQIIQCLRKPGIEVLKWRINGQNIKLYSNMWNFYLWL